MGLRTLSRPLRTTARPESAAVPEVADEILAEIRRAVPTPIRDLELAVQGRDVILTGVTHTYYAKQVATHVVINRLHNISLTNDIQVV